jgi:ribosomal protein S18 acetylase RimI-like enzyme
MIEKRKEISMASEIKAIAHSRERFLDLLLLANPSEEMVLKYLEVGYLFVLFEGDEAYGVIHLAPQEGNVIEIKNLAVKQEAQGLGYGKKLVQHARAFCKQRGYDKIIVGTGNSSINNVAFYQKVGFRFLSILRDFFTAHYDEPIFENGIQCRDMLLLELDLTDE